MPQGEVGTQRQVDRTGPALHRPFRDLRQRLAEPLVVAVRGEDIGRRTIALAEELFEGRIREADAAVGRDQLARLRQSGQLRVGDRQPAPAPQSVDDGDNDAADPEGQGGDQGHHRDREARAPEGAPLRRLGRGRSGHAAGQGEGSEDRDQAPDGHGSNPLAAWMSNRAAPDLRAPTTSRRSRQKALGSFEPNL